jgi:predicted CXXCH cytochrome family protein
LNKQDLRAPNCATCHGTHGATPPGVTEVANVCGNCHTATQTYYLKSVHTSTKPGTPKCETCHGQHDVMPPTDDLFTGTGTRACGSCHPAASPQASAIKVLYDSITTSAKMVDDAEKKLGEAAKASLIIAPEEVKLAEARTNLITARAAQHTLDQAVVKGSTDKAEAKAKEVIADADKAISDSIFRRQWMAFGLAVMVLAIVSLWIIRRELYKELPPE